MSHNTIWERSRSLALTTIATIWLVLTGSVGCSDLEPLRPPIDSEALQSVLAEGSVLFSGQSNAAAAAFTPDGQERAETYNSAALRTWNEGWNNGNAALGGDEPPGVGLLAGSLGWLLESEQGLSVELLGNPWPGAHIARMGPDSENYLSLHDRVVASGTEPAVLLWHQGESDGIEKTSRQAYEDALNELIEAWHQDYPSLQYIVVFLTAENACDYDQSEVRAAQRNVAAAHDDVLLVDSDWLSGTEAHGDGCHYEWSGYEEQAWYALHEVAQAAASGAPATEPSQQE